MTDNLRDRIAAVLGANSHMSRELQDHLADVLIRDLGWREETQTLGDGMGGVSINSKTGERTFHHRAATRQSRYVTEWTTDE